VEVDTDKRYSRRESKGADKPAQRENPEITVELTEVRQAFVPHSE
jgi:hypothetical protein